MSGAPSENSNTTEGKSVKSGFDKSRRLLNAGDFKNVFDGASFKLGNDSFLLLARPSSLGHARLGLVVAKKNIRRAVDRNRIKRVVRETFRQYQDHLDTLDIVFLARRGLHILPNSDQTRLVREGWRRLEKKLAHQGGRSR